MGVKSISLVAMALVLSSSVNATIVDLGNITRDTTSGRDWLDLTDTTNTSYNQMLLEVGVGGQLEGWTIASYSDVEELFDNAGGDGNYPGTQTVLASNLLPLWGVTGFQPDETWFSVSDSGTNSGATSGVIFGLDGSLVYSSNFALKDQESPGLGTALYQVSSVPVPAAVWLFGSGLLGLIGLARRKKA